MAATEPSRTSAASRPTRCRTHCALRCHSMLVSPASRTRVAVFSLVLALAVSTLPGEVIAADPAIVAAGDIACPDPCRAQRRTARPIRVLDPRAVLTLGDNQYEDGRFADFMDSYQPTWGRFKRRTHPTPGNHDYHVAGARGYFSYFGRRAHRRSGGMYSVSIGNWHVVSINTGNGLSDRKLRWIRRNLSNDRHRCELAFWHHPAGLPVRATGRTRGWGGSGRSSSGTASTSR